ncbi:phosphonate C-P lyase system protein PhnG [Salipiger sp.]|uniref:phosphonate C-P lyase system protein PhnG n=1 Tax=Salipiger sp. TaxID=2078585 RepID=UPI003A982612
MNATKTATKIDTAERQAWMGLLARAPAPRLAGLMRAVARPGFTWLRRPEVGGVMVRGRTGGTGAPFNLGEMTVTRCALRLDTGEVGHAHVQGRDKAHAEAAALVDAMMTGPDASAVRAAVLDPLAGAEQAARLARAARAEATKVAFFTMVRGED